MQNLSIKRKQQISTGVVLFLIMLVIVLSAFNTKTTALRINEVAYSQDDGIDWIELYNPSQNNITLNGLYLSDTIDKLERYKIKDTLLVPAGGYAVIYGDRAEAENSEVSTNFNISAGETVFLIGSDGTTIIDELFISPNSENNTTIGRYPDGADEIQLLDISTPGLNNKGS